MSNMIAVCDTDEYYAISLSNSIAAVVTNLFRVTTFTNIGSLMTYMSNEQVTVLIISESTYDSSIINSLNGTLIVLRENPSFVLEGAILIDRFQSRDGLLNSVIKNLPDDVDSYAGKRLETYRWKTIGIYSPIHRCLQTTYALALGQILAQKHKVLYMNFESFSGFSGWLSKEFESDIVDILYFYNCSPDKLKTRIPAAVHKIGNLDILPPANAYYDTYEKTGEMWIQLLDAIENVTDYEYLILDLSDAMHGLFKVLGYCDRIYTLVKGDSLSRHKIAQYEKWMVEHDYADIIGKSKKFSFPEFDDIPERPDMLTHCQLSGYIKAILDEDKIGE